MAVEDYTALINKAQQARDNNGKAWDDSETKLSDARDAAEALADEVRKNMIYFKGMQVQAKELWTAWENAAAAIIPLQAKLKNEKDKKKKKEIETEIEPHHKKAEKAKERLNKLLGEVNGEQRTKLGKAEQINKL